MLQSLERERKTSIKHNVSISSMSWKEIVKVYWGRDCGIDVTVNTPLAGLTFPRVTVGHTPWFDLYRAKWMHELKSPPSRTFLFPLWFWVSACLHLQPLKTRCLCRLASFLWERCARLGWPTSARSLQHEVEEEETEVHNYCFSISRTLCSTPPEELTGIGPGSCWRQHLRAFAANETLLQMVQMNGPSFQSPGVRGQALHGFANRCFAGPDTVTSSISETSQPDLLSTEELRFWKAAHFTYFP